ncbi:hypothetical protein GWK47_007033 [Chionoecetes opilio]|uniref:Uncharacterized protein n=1 Tax=Chionoecetes opilio TaxID=41210 RepID=A0A8J4Y9G0_CHIOP|nr:hypothetical protein GWK47_007033 [Chionoecetes opilio]
MEELKQFFEEINWEEMNRVTNVQDQPSNRSGKVGILKPQGSLERSRETRDQQESSDTAEKFPEGAGEKEDSREKGQHQQHVQQSHLQAQEEQQQQQHQPQEPQQQKQQSMVPGQPRTPRTRTNVALQAIIKRNSAMQEAKQVTFRTPSPTISPNPSEASSDSHRSQLSTPPLMTPTSQRNPLSSSPMPHHHGHIYQIDLPQGQDNSFGRQNQGNENNFSNQQQYGGLPGGLPSWGGIGVLPGNFTQPNMQRSYLHQNQLMSTGVNLKNQSNSSGQSPLNILQQLQTSTSQSMLAGGMFCRPPLESFHQLGGSVPPRPVSDISGRIMEPASRILETMGMTHALPSYGHVEGLPNTCRTRPPGTEAVLDSSHMTKAPLRGQQGQQDSDENGSHSKINHVTHPLFSANAMNSHQYGMECRQSVSGSGGPVMSSGMSVFGDSDAGLSRGPGLNWGARQSDGKNYPVSHPHPPTLANLLQQHNPVDMRQNLPGEQGAEQLNSRLARLSAGHSVHTSTINPPSPPSGAVHFGMLPMPSSQTPCPAPHNQLARGQHFLQELKRPRLVLCVVCAPFLPVLLF